MKHGSSLGAAALLSALLVASTASAQVSPPTSGIGDARMQNQPSATGLGSTESRAVPPVAGAPERPEQAVKPVGRTRHGQRQRRGKRR